MGKALISSRNPKGFIQIFASFIHGRDEIDINGTNRSEIYSEKKKKEARIICRERILVIVRPTGRERDVQEMLEYSLINRPA